MDSHVAQRVSASFLLSKTDRSRLAQSLGESRPATLFAIAFLLLLSLFTRGSFAQDLNPSDMVTDLSGDNRDVPYLPGESYDILSGTMRHFMTDLTFRGNGRLPIVVSRRHGTASHSLRPELNYFALDIPALTFVNGNRNGFTGQCDNTRLLNADGLYAQDDAQRRHTAMTFVHGKSSMQFFSTLAVEQPGDISRFAGRGADFVSASNWYIKCVDTTNGNDEYHLYSPNGTVYVMGKGVAYRTLGYRSDGTNSNYVSYVTWRVSEIIDPYGNTLTYVYENNIDDGTTYGRPRILNSALPTNPDKLTKIVANDGREVDFTYQQIGGEWYLQKVESNGSPNKHLVVYTYGAGNTSLTVNYDNTSSIIYDYVPSSNGVINKITYPLGGTVTYSYNPTNFTAGHFSQSTNNSAAYGSYKPLISRSQSDGSVYNFRYQPINDKKFKRIIDTPERTIEYTYKKTNKDARMLVPAALAEADDGRLLSIREYGQVVPTNHSEVPILEKNFTYQSISSVTAGFAPDGVSGSLQMQGTNLVVPDEVETIVSSVEYPAVKQIFTRKYEDHDEYGMPKRIKEVSAAGDIRYITSTYRNNFSDWIRLKPLSNVIRKTPYGSAVDTSTFLYNDQGDVIESVSNGIATKTEYFDTGPYKGHINTIKDGLNNTYTYNSYYRGIATSETDQRQRTQTREVTSDGSLRRETRLGDSLQWIYHYDEARRLERIESPRSSTSDTFISWTGLTKRTQTQGGNALKRESFYDQFGREVFSGSYTNRNGGTWISVKSEYDSLGRLTYRSYPAAVSSANRNASGPIDTEGVTYIYDSSGRVIEILREADVDDVRTSYSYASNDSSRIKLTKTDGRSKSTIEEYISYGSPSYSYLSKQISDNGVVTTYARDESYRVNTFNRDGLVRSYSYNTNKLVGSMWNPENGTTSYSYYPNGWLEQKVNQQEVSDYFYYGDGSYNYTVMSGVGDSVTRTYGYDSYGNLSTLANQSGSSSNSWAYSYDVENNLTSETLALDGKQYAIFYEYDDLSNHTRTTYPNQRQYDYDPDGFGRSGSIKEVNGKVIYDAITYHPNGRSKLLNRSGHRIENTIDKAQRSRKKMLIRNSNHQKLGDRQYSYDAASNLNNIYDFIGNRAIAIFYDDLNRLDRVQTTDLGNWDYAYNNQDDITQIVHGGVTENFNYDNSKRLLISVESSNPTKSFAYDLQGSMIVSDGLSSDNYVVTRNIPRNSAGQVASLTIGSATTYYEYDGYGRRVKKNKGGSIYTIYDSAGQLVYRDNVIDDITSEYHYVAGELIARRDIESGGGSSGTSGPPDAPTGVTATPSGNNIVLSWVDVPAAEKFNVYVDNNYHTTVGKVTTYTHVAPSSGPHSYALTAVDEDQTGSDQFSVSSATVTATAGSGGGGNGVETVTSFSAAAFSGTAAELYWGVPSDSDEGGTATDYEIYKDGNLLITTGNSGSFWLAVGLSPNQVYQFEIVAIYPSGAKSPKSNVISLLMANGQQSY